MQGEQPVDKVSVGPTTVIGGGLGLVTFVGAGVAVLTGEATTEEVAVFASGVLVLVTVLGGRYAQAVVQILAEALGRLKIEKVER